MIRFAQANETMVANDQYIFQFKLPDWFSAQQLPADDFQRRMAALKSAAQLAITGQRLGVSFVDAYPTNNNTIYVVIVKPTRAESTTAIWNALTPVLTSALNPPTGFAGITPYYQGGGGGGGTSTSWTQYKPLLIGLGVVLAFMLLSGRRY